MDDPNASIKRTLAKFEAGVHSSLRVREILLDASYIVQTNKKLGSPRRLTTSSLITSWITESTKNLAIVREARADLNKRRPCCLQPERCTATNDSENVKAGTFKYKHDECAGLAMYWAEKLRTMTMRNANLQVALAIVNERQLDLNAFRKQAMKAIKAKTETFRPSSFPRTASETRSMEFRCASPELLPSPPPAAKQDKDKDKPTKSVSFARSTDQLGQEAASRAKRSFNRCKLDSYVPGRWAPPNRKPAPDADPRKRGKRSRVSTKYPFGADQYPLEPFDPYGPPSFFNTYADYSLPSTLEYPPCPSLQSEPDGESVMEHDDLFLDTSGARVKPSDFYHDDPLLDPEERALEAERCAIWDAYLPPVPAAKTTLLERVKRRWSCVF